jgi:hypothetical protein
VVDRLLERLGEESADLQVLKCRVQDVGSNIYTDAKQVRMPREIDLPGSVIANDDLQMMVDSWMSGNRCRAIASKVSSILEITTNTAGMELPPTYVAYRTNSWLYLGSPLSY